MKYEYLPLLYESKKTSGHTQEELNELLNRKGKEGWRLAHIIEHNQVQWTLVFERQAA